MLSITEAEAQVGSQKVVKFAQAAHFWLPNVPPLFTHEDSELQSRSFSMRDGGAVEYETDVTRVRSSNPQDTHRTHARPKPDDTDRTGCASSHVCAPQMWYYIKQKLYRFYYPFDEQELVLDLPFDRTTEGEATANGYIPFSSCGEPDMVSLAKFPQGSEWMLNGDIRSELQPDGCRVVIPIRYSPATWMWQFFLPTTLVSLGSIFAIVLDAKEGGVVAARSSVLLVAMLLFVEASAEFFTMPYLLWINLFSLLQIALLTFALIETWIVYRISIHNPHLSDAIDHISQFVFPALYCTMVGFMVLWAMGKLAFAFILTMNSFCILGWLSASSVKRRMAQRRSRINRILASLRQFDPKDQKSMA
eukprot:7385042-Prymnesium_polylepis.1